jgi:hypothetical protein
VEINCFSKKQGAEVPMSLPLPTKMSDMWQGYESRTLDLRTCERYLLFRKAVLGLHFNLRLGFSAMARGSAKNPNHVFSISDLVTRRKVFLEFHFQMSLN